MNESTSTILSSVKRDYNFIVTAAGNSLVLCIRAMAVHKLLGPKLLNRTKKGSLGFVCGFGRRDSHCNEMLNSSVCIWCLVWVMFTAVESMIHTSVGVSLNICVSPTGWE